MVAVDGGDVVVVVVGLEVEAGRETGALLLAARAPVDEAAPAVACLAAAPSALAS